MTRGRPSTTGISGAAPVARARGEFVPIGTCPESVFSFMIRTPATLTFVRVQYVTSLYLPVADVGEQHHDLIAQLRSRCSPAVAEIWPYNKHGSYRYFRIGDSGITELDNRGDAQVSAEQDGNARPDTGKKEGA
jgi:hypothetical protein